MANEWVLSACVHATETRTTNTRIAICHRKFCIHSVFQCVQRCEVQVVWHTYAFVTYPPPFSSFYTYLLVFWWKFPSLLSTRERESNRFTVFTDINNATHNGKIKRIENIHSIIHRLRWNLFVCILHCAMNSQSAKHFTLDCRWMAVEVVNGESNPNQMSDRTQRHCYFDEIPIHSLGAINKTVQQQLITLNFVLQFD